MNTSKIKLNNELNKISYCAIQRKMNVRGDSSKQAQEVIFSGKIQKTDHNRIYYNHNSV